MPKATPFVMPYGLRLLEIGRGKTAIVVGAMDDLIPVINTIIEAVAAGELDAAIKTVPSFGNQAKKSAN